MIEDPSEGLIRPCEPQYPTCPHCFAEVTCDSSESFDCEDCGISWPVTNFGGEVGYYTDDEAKRCNALSGIEDTSRELGNMLIVWSMPPCVLPAGHKTEEHWHPQQTRHIYKKRVEDVHLP